MQANLFPQRLEDCGCAKISHRLQLDHRSRLVHVGDAFRATIVLEAGAEGIFWLASSGSES